MCLFRCNFFIGFRIIKEMSGLVAGGTPCKKTAFEMCWHTRRNKISYFGETYEYTYIGGGVSSVDYWQASCEYQPAGFILLVRVCVLQSCHAYWLPTPLYCFPFTSPPVRHRVPSHFNWTLPQRRFRSYVRLCRPAATQHSCHHQFGTDKKMQITSSECSYQK
jgi:hypothetical protein